MIKRFFPLLILLSTLLSACAPNISPNTYTGDEVGVVSRVKKGVIIAKRSVRINNQSGAGGLVGSAAGAAGGSLLGSNTPTNIIGAIGGAVFGGLIGNAIDKGVNNHHGFEYIIKLSKGQTISVVQTRQMQFYPGQHVLVIYGAMTRIVPDYTN